MKLITFLNLSAPIIFFNSIFLIFLLLLEAIGVTLGVHLTQVPSIGSFYVLFLWVITVGAFCSLGYKHSKIVFCIFPLCLIISFLIYIHWLQCGYIKKWLEVLGVA